MKDVLNLKTASIRNDCATAHCMGDAQLQEEKCRYPKELVVKYDVVNLVYQRRLRYSGTGYVMRMISYTTTK